MNFKRIFDMDLVRETIADPDIYARLSDDGSPKREDFRPIESELVHYIAAYDGGDYMGLWMFVPRNVICWEVHTCLLKRAWGRSVELARGCVAWIWANTSVQRIISEVPANNPLALRLALKSGMTVFGTNERSSLKNGELIDCTWVGISRPLEA